MGGGIAEEPSVGGLGGQIDVHRVGRGLNHKVAIAAVLVTAAVDGDAIAGAVGAGGQPEVVAGQQDLIAHRSGKAPIAVQVGRIIAVVIGAEDG